MCKYYDLDKIKALEQTIADNDNKHTIYVRMTVEFTAKLNKQDTENVEQGIMTLDDINLRYYLDNYNVAELINVEEA